MIKFNKRDSKKMLKEVARLRGVSVAEVREEMQLAIEEARNNPDAEKQAEFQRLFGKLQGICKYRLHKKATRCRICANISQSH